MLDGVDLNEIELDTGVDVAQMRADNLRFCFQQGWLVESQQKVRLTDAGLLMADVVASAFLVETLVSNEILNPQSLSDLPLR